MSVLQRYVLERFAVLSSEGVSPVDAVALPLALRALTAEKAFSESATNSVRA